MYSDNQLQISIVADDPASPIQPRAIFLIGPPGSGKTTWRRRYLERAIRPTVILSTDDMIEMVADARGITYSEAFEMVSMRDLEDKLFDGLTHAVKGGCDIVVDRTNMKRSSRQNILRRLPLYYRREAMVFMVEPGELQRRLADRALTTGKHIPPEVVADMVASYVAPDADEFDLIERV